MAAFYQRKTLTQSPSHFMEHGAPVLRIDGEMLPEPQSKFYPDGHPLARKGTPNKKIFQSHPIRTGGTMTTRRVPRNRQSPHPQHKQRAHQQSPMPRTPPTRRAAWDSTNSDLSQYSLSEEERLRRKRILRTPVDTGRTVKQQHRNKSVAASPGAARGPKKHSSKMNTPKRAWIPSGKNQKNSLLARTPGFVDESWRQYTPENLQNDDDGDDGEVEVEVEVEETDELEEEASNADEAEYNDIDREADPFRTPSVEAAAPPPQRTDFKRTQMSFRKPHERMSLHSASKAWAQRQEANPDVFTAQVAERMSAQKARHRSPEQHTILKRMTAPPPRPMKASTELGRQRRAEQEGAFIELEAQLTRLRHVKGIQQETVATPSSASDLSASPSASPSSEPTRHWIGFHADMPTTNALLNNTPSSSSSSTYDTRTMLTSLAHVASTLASSLAENEIRLQEESRERQHIQDILLETQSELKHLKAQQSEDSEAIARMITQMPDIALNYLVSSPSSSAAAATITDEELAHIDLNSMEKELHVAAADEVMQESERQVLMVEKEDMMVEKSCMAEVTSHGSGGGAFDYASLVKVHSENTMEEPVMSENQLEMEQFAMTSNDVVAVAALPDMNLSNVEEVEEEEEEAEEDNNVEEETNDVLVSTHRREFTVPRTTMMGYTIIDLGGEAADEMAREEVPRPAPRMTVPMPTISSGPSYRNTILDSPLDAPLGKIDYSSYMKQAAMNVAPEATSPVRGKKNSAAAWLSRKK